MARLHSGIFITVEGGEGAGKSSLIKALSQYFTKEKQKFVVTSFEPGATDFGKKIRSLLLDEEATTYICPKTEFFLFQADRAQHVETLIMPALEQGMMVIVDRFVDSSLVYQGYAAGMKEMASLEKICDFATGGLVPDITIFLDIDPKMGLSRIKGKKDRMESKELLFHQKVREGFLTLAKRYPKRIQTIDGTKSQEEVFQIVKNLILAKIM